MDPNLFQVLFLQLISCYFTISNSYLPQSFSSQFFSIKLTASRIIYHNGYPGRDTRCKAPQSLSIKLSEFPSYKLPYSQSRKLPKVYSRKLSKFPSYKLPYPPSRKLFKVHSRKLLESHIHQLP